MPDLLLEEHYILYIDLLGYKVIINEIPEQEFLKIINKSYNEAKRIINIMSQPTHSNSVFDYKVFSDNIVVATTADSIYALYSLSYIAYILQRAFIDKKILCRGAITKGLLYIDQEYVFGSGLIRAYELEDTVAYYPRIILDRLAETAELLKLYDVYYKDNDGYIIIDYLRNREQEIQRSVLFLTKHKQVIESGLGKKQKNECVYQKYAWCREYHNSVCSRYGTDNLSITDTIE